MRTSAPRKDDLAFINILSPALEHNTRPYIVQCIDRASWLSTSLPIDQYNVTMKATIGLTTHAGLTNPIISLLSLCQKARLQLLTH